MENPWKFIHGTKFAYDLRVCHDLDTSLRSFLQVQGH